VGKSTLTAWIAVAALSDNPQRKVAVFDLDPQGSLTLWWNRRGGNQPFLVNPEDNRPIANIQRDLALAGYDLLVVDCPPGFSIILREAIAAADLALIPTGTSALDLEAVGSTAAIAERARVPSRYVLNRAQFRSRSAGQAVTALRRLGGLLAVVHMRVAVTDAVGRGLTAMETQPVGRAAQEQRELWRAVRAALAETPMRRMQRTARNSTSHIGAPQR
jgi:chromosome partitioning protein